MVPADRTYNRGENVVLECRAMGGPNNRFLWLLNGTILQSETSSALRLLNVRAANGGTYTCMVSNSAGTSRATTSIYISPYFASQPQDVGGANGTVATLFCDVEAFPNPTYQWSLARGGTIREAVMGQNTARLTFNPLMFGDEGDYICTAVSNGIQIQSQSLTLTGKIASLCEPDQSIQSLLLF